MPNSFEVPTWRGTSLDSPITKVAIPLIAVRDEVVYPSGTACLIGPWLAITARHVVEDHFEHFAGRSPGPNDQAVHHTLTYVLPGNGEPVLPLFVSRTWYLEPYDIAVLHLVPAAEMDLHRIWDTPIIKLLPPRPGSQVFAFGYPNSTFETGIGELRMDATTTTGTVIEVHHDRRDSGRLTFPCFRTDARFDGGMSGGPVFDAAGHVCGIICSNMPPTTLDGEHVSYVSTLWPALSIPIDAAWDRYPPGSKYPLYEYAEAGIINVVGLEHLTLERGSEHNRVICRYDTGAYGS